MSQQSTDLTEKPIMIISGHEHIIRGIAYIPGGERIVTCSYDRSIRIWNVEKGDQEGTSMMHEGYVHGLAVTRDGKRILSCGDKKVGVWDVETHEQIEEWASHTSNISCIALSPDDQFVANGDEGGQVMIWKVESGEITRVIYAGTGRVNSLCFSPNGEKLACAVDNVDMIYLVQIYDLESGEIVLGPIQGHENTVRCVLWSLDGSQLFSASDDHTIRCWDPESVDSIGPPWTGHTDAVLSLSLSPDGTTLASASYDKTVRFWDARFGGLIGPPLQHEAWLYAVTFSPCGEFIASGARDRRLYIYGVPWRGESQEQANHSLLESAWNLNEIHSTVAHCDLTGYVVRDGDHPLASGSFGDVYRGKLHVGGRPVDVAVKAIKTYAADDGDYSKKNKRLRRELTTWANLNHVNILPLYGTTMSFGRFPAMVCPWLENGSLTSYLECRHDTLKVVERLVL
ncbi:WD40 repeat-like protein [Paxillus ammoniavirescens]|nr:WD40 repeat-like protein [Paxillus ammoniavirescens]